MFKKNLKISVTAFLIIVYLVSTNFSTFATTVRVILDVQNVTDITGKIIVEGETYPVDTPYMSVMYQDNQAHPGNAISIPVTYDASAFTGFNPASPRSTWQRGEFDDAVNGSPVFQLQGVGGGMFMNSWFTTYQEIRGGGQAVCYQYAFSEPSSPWTNSTSKLWVQADLKLPWFSRFDINNDNNWPVGQLSFDIYLNDTSTNTCICIIVNAFDNRSEPPESIQNDTWVNFASTHFGGTRYCTPNQFSSSWTNSTWNTWQFYRAEITRQNLINIASDINDLGGSQVSENPSDYILTAAGILQETFRDEGDQISMGSSFLNFSIYEDY